MWPSHVLVIAEEKLLGYYPEHDVVDSGVVDGGVVDGGFRLTERTTVLRKPEAQVFPAGELTQPTEARGASREGRQGRAKGRVMWQNSVHSERL